MGNKYSIDDARLLAASKGGRCVSSTFIGTRNVLEWECASGHVFTATMYRANQTWCPLCNPPKKYFSYTIEDAKRYAEKKGGKCLSDRFINTTTKLSWQCASRHTWDASPVNVIYNGSWCPHCAKTLWKIEDMHEFARKKGGTCLSTTYINQYQNLTWQCKLGHKWVTAPKNIINGRWCPVCAKVTAKNPKKVTIERAQELAKQKGGFCLSPAIVNTKQLLDWQCQLGHLWKARYIDIHNGSWCPTCANGKRGGDLIPTLDGMRAFASSKKGRCLSSLYVNAKTHLEWQCFNGHVFKATWSNVKKGRWCPECAGNKPLTKQQLEAIASSNGGYLISCDVARSASRAIWQCKEGHVWEAITSSAIKGMWCPICAGKISTSTSPGIISSTFAIIMHAKKWTELKNILYQQQITRQHIDPVEINHLMVNDVKIAMDIILGKDTPYLACTTETEFSTFEDLVSFQEKSMLPLQKDETAHSAFFVEINTKIRHLASILREVQGRDLTPVIASLLSAPFGKEAYDTIFMWTADALGSSDRHGITIGDAFIAHEADLDKMINFARKLHLSENFEGKSAMSWLVGKEMRALLQYVTGKQDHLPIIASKCQIKEFQASLQLQETPDFLPFKEGFMIRRAFYQEALARRDQAKKLLAEVDGCDVSNVIAGVYHKQFPELGLRVMQIYMQELQVPFTYDDFDLVSTPEYSWFLGALLAEGTITKHNVNYNSVRLRINETNPAIFFDHAIPLVRHPSFTGQELTLSPALTRFLFPDMKRGEQVSKHLIPFDHVNRDMFLAGFFDCHGCVSRPRSICLHLPYKTPEAWLDIMPFTMPATLTGDIFDQSTPYTHYNPSERNTFRVHICGRRVPEDSGLPDEERASIVADNIRYWFKKIFPHCVHPRLELIHQVGEYMDMRFGKAKNASTYTNILRNLLDTSHRIDLSGIEDTLSRPLRDPRTGNTILYIPKWLDQFNKRHGFSMGDMLASCDRSGGFVPFPCMQQDMESSLDTDEADW